MMMMMMMTETHYLDTCNLHVPSTDDGECEGARPPDLRLV